MNTLIRSMSAEAHEIVTNIRIACQEGEITYQQRDELMVMVMTDVNSKLELARNMLYYWTGNRYDSPNRAE